MKRLFTGPMPDWTDREAVAEFAASRAEILGDDPVAARAIAARIWDRTPGTAPPTQMANQLGMVFAKLNCKTPLARAPTRDRGPHARRPRPPGPVLPRWQRRGNRARDPRGTAARPRRSCHCDPRCGGRRGRRGHGHAGVEDGACHAGMASAQRSGRRSSRVPRAPTAGAIARPGRIPTATGGFLVPEPGWKLDPASPVRGGFR